MKVLLASSEAVPFAKTGGLADVAGALPKALAKAGVDVRLILPKYKGIEEKGLPMDYTGIHVAVPVSQTVVDAEIVESRLKRGDGLPRGKGRVFLPG